MSQTENQCEDQQPREFPLVSKDTNDSAPKVEPSHELDGTSAVDTVQHEEYVESREHPQQQEHEDYREPSGAGNNDVEADNFLHPREVILAREAIRIRHGRGLLPLYQNCPPANTAQDVPAV
jgi:hypothetical protein